MVATFTKRDVGSKDVGNTNPRLPFRAGHVQFGSADTLSEPINCQEMRGAGLGWPAGIWGASTIGYLQVAVLLAGEYSRVKDDAGADVTLTLTAKGNKQFLDLATFGFIKLELNVSTGVTPVKAVGTLTLTANPTNSQTVTIGTTVYTFRTVLINQAGSVLIGATASDSLDNLIDAILRTEATFGVKYGSNTVVHPDVIAAAGAGDTMTVTAKEFGAEGNAIATTETLANGSFGAATLTGGVTAGRFELGMA